MEIRTTQGNMPTATESTETTSKLGEALKTIWSALKPAQQIELFEMTKKFLSDNGEAV